jgi:ribonuclease HI
VNRIDGLTSNQAEYRALLSGVKNLREGSRASVFSDSQLMCEQFNGRYRVRDLHLQKLLARVQQVIAERRLTVTLAWVPREQNLAGKLLDGLSLEDF